MLGKLERLLDELSQVIPFHHLLQPNISQSNIGWHIEHSLLSIERVIDSLAAPKKNAYRPRYNVAKAFVFTTGIIPRGRGQSPAAVRPVGDNTVEALTDHLIKTRIYLRQLPLMDKNQFFDHPYFGSLKRKQTIRFLEIHTHHHIKIIRQIKGG